MAVPQTTILVGWGDVFGAGQQGANIAPKHLLSANRNGVQRSAMERVPHGDGFVTTGNGSGQFEGDADGACTAGTEKHPS